MNEALLIGGVIELAKLGLTVWLQASAMANLTEEQKARIFEETRAKFEAKDPAKLPDV